MKVQELLGLACCHNVCFNGYLHELSGHAKDLFDCYGILRRITVQNSVDHSASPSHTPDKTLVLGDLTPQTLKQKPCNLNSKP